jgi:hypothetical protein
MVDPITNFDVSEVATTVGIYNAVPESIAWRICVSVSAGVELDAIETEVVMLLPPNNKVGGVIVGKSCGPASVSKMCIFIGVSCVSGIVYAVPLIRHPNAYVEGDDVVVVVVVVEDVLGMVMSGMQNVPN